MPRISDDMLLPMYERANIRRETLLRALRIMGPRELKGAKFRRAWTHDNPTKNYCYVISEFVYYYLAPPGSKPYSLKGIPSDDGLHRFIRWPDGFVVDLAVEQFSNFEDVDYSRGKVRHFMPTGGSPPSRRARRLASLCGYVLQTQHHTPTHARQRD